MKKIFFLLPALLLLTGCAKCEIGHTELVHHPGYTTAVLVGKVMVPQFHPARDSNDFICDKYEESK